MITDTLGMHCTLSHAVHARQSHGVDTVTYQSYRPPLLSPKYIHAILVFYGCDFNTKGLFSPLVRPCYGLNSNKRVQQSSSTWNEWISTRTSSCWL